MRDPTEQLEHLIFGDRNLTFNLPIITTGSKLSAPMHVFQQTLAVSRDRVAVFVEWWSDARLIEAHVMLGRI
jgi:hypothetical protein